MNVFLQEITQFVIHRTSRLPPVPKPGMRVCPVSPGVCVHRLAARQVPARATLLRSQQAPAAQRCGALSRALSSDLPKYIFQSVSVEMTETERCSYST